MMLGHHAQRIAHGSLGCDGHGIVNHTVFGTFDGTDLLTLLVDGHVLVDDADTAGTGHGDGQVGLRHGIHRRRHNRGVEGNISGKPRSNIYVSGKNLRTGGNQEYVIEGETFGNFSGNELLHRDKFNLTKLTINSQKPAIFILLLYVFVAIFA